ncbi:hypothetical protein FOZ63_009553, partial [Perkinsus olseni]
KKNAKRRRGSDGGIDTGVSGNAPPAKKSDFVLIVKDGRIFHPYPKGWLRPLCHSSHLPGRWDEWHEQKLNAEARGMHTDTPPPQLRMETVREVLKGKGFKVSLFQTQRGVGVGCQTVEERVKVKQSIELLDSSIPVVVAPAAELVAVAVEVVEKIVAALVVDVVLVTGPSVGATLLLTALVGVVVEAAEVVFDWPQKQGTPDVVVDDGLVEVVRVEVVAVSVVVVTAAELVEVE